MNFGTLTKDTKYKLSHKRLGHTMHAEDSCDIHAQLIIWGDLKEWGSIKPIDIFLSEVDYLIECKKQGFIIESLKPTVN